MSHFQIYVMIKLSKVLCQIQFRLCSIGYLFVGCWSSMLLLTGDLNLKPSLAIMKDTCTYQELMRSTCDMCLCKVHELMS